MSSLDYQVAQLRLAVSNLVRLGEIDEVDLNHSDGPRVRVRLNETLRSPWLPVPAEVAANYTRWSPLTPGIQCVLISPAGDLSQARITQLLYSPSRPPPSLAADADVIAFDDGLTVEYHSASHHLSITGPANSQLTLSFTGGLSIDGDITLNGALSATGEISSNIDIKGDGISLKNHTHGGVQGGTGLTGAPQ